MSLRPASRGLRRSSLLAMALLISGAGSSEAQVWDPELAVATFDSAWTRISATYYDPGFGGLDWEAVRDELRPRAAAARDRDELRGVIGEMLDRIGDSHFGVIPEEVADALEPEGLAAGEVESPGTVGMELRLLDGQLTVTRVREGFSAREAGVEPGWVVTRIRETDMAPRIQALDDLEDEARGVAAMNLEARANGALVGALDQPVTVGFLDPWDRPVILDLERDPVVGTPIQYGNLPTFFVDLEHREIPADQGCVGYIRFNIWMPPMAGPFDEAMSDLVHCRGIVLDIRGNPGGAGGMVMGISGYFTEEKEALGILKTRDTELRLVANPRRIRSGDGYLPPFAGPLVILIDGQSASTSEIFALGMQVIGRARLVGETTAGMALPARMERLPNGDVLMYAFANLTGPKGTRIEGRGAIPDLEVPLTRSGLLQGRDAPLKAALDWIVTQPKGDGPAPRQPDPSN